MKWIGIVTVFLFVLFNGHIVFSSFKLKRKGINPAVQTRLVKAVFTSAFLGLFILIFAYEMLAQSFPFIQPFVHRSLSSPVLDSYTLNLTGLLFSLCSVYFIKRTLFSFEDSLRFGLDPANKGKLITTGALRFSRNPFFLSLEMQFLGIALVYGTWFFIGIFALSILAIHFHILKEEHFMRANYGEEYKKYCRKVRRYF